jgi:transcriptional regulator with XRE-family HTH domain
MNDEKLKIQIGANIALYRKNAGLTQAGLAAKLNYSDKAVSKWERGESVPDVITLMILAELFEITVNDLLSDPNALPEDTDPGTLEKAMTKVSAKRRKYKAGILYLTQQGAASSGIKILGRVLTTGCVHLNTLGTDLGSLFDSSAALKAKGL